MAFFWQPTFYFEVFSVTLQSASLYSCLPWIASAGTLNSMLCMSLCRAATASLPVQPMIHLYHPGF